VTAPFYSDEYGAPPPSLRCQLTILVLLTLALIITIGTMVAVVL
jgi:hypothetical protein